MTHDLDDPALAHRHGFSIAQGALNFGIAAVVRRPLLKLPTWTISPL